MEELLNELNRILDHTLNRAISARERIAKAQEKIAATGDLPLVITRGGYTAGDTSQAVQVQEVAAAIPSAQPETSPAVQEPLPEREDLKRQLREKGIAFKEAAKTETLKKLLLQANTPEPVPTCCLPSYRDWDKHTEDDGTVVETLYCRSCGRIHELKKNGAFAEFDQGSTFLPQTIKIAESQEADPSLMPPQTEPVGRLTRDQVRDALVSLSAAKGKDSALKVMREFGKAEKLTAVPEDHFSAIMDQCKKMMGGEAHA